MIDLDTMGSIPLATLAVTLLFVAADFTGRLIVGSRITERWQGIDVCLLRLAVGLNLLGLIGVSLGIFDLLGQGRSAWLLVALTGCSVPRAWRAWREGKWRSAVAEVRGNDRVRSTLVSRILLVTLALVSLGPALCYPSGWDELVYQLELPRRWLADGRPMVYSDLPYSGFPSLGPILFWLMAPIEGVIAPRLLVWVCWMIGLIALYRLLGRRLSLLAAAVLTLAFSLNDTVLMISADCYVECLMLMNAAGIFLALGLPSSPGAAGPRWTQAAVLGVLAGGAASVKLTGGALVVVPVLWYAGEAWRSRADFRRVTIEALVYLGTLACVGLPFYARPWLATGNPFYPYLCAWFTDDPVLLEMSHYQHLIGGYAFGVKTLAAFVDGPVLLAFSSKNYDGQFGWQLLVMLMLAIVAVASWRRPRLRPLILWPVVSSLWLYVFWFSTAQQARFAVPALLAMMPLVGLGLRRFRRVGRQMVLISLLVLALASIPWRNTAYYWCSWLTAVGQMSRIEYLDIATDRTYLPLVDKIAEITPPDAKLLLLFEHRGFYLPRQHLIGTPLFQAGLFALPEQYVEPAPVIDALRQNGITHVIVAKFPMGPDHAPDERARQLLLLRGMEACERQGTLHSVDQDELQHYLIFEVR